MTKEELLANLEHWKWEKSVYEKDLPKNFRRTNSIFQYGRASAFVEELETLLEKFKK
jgi:hypothetical protein